MSLEVTGRIQVGRFVFEIGHPAGTRADLAPEPGGANPAPLALALDQPEPADALTHAEAAVEDAASVTGRVERALELFTAVAQGRVDRQVVLKEVDVLIGALERADREGRYADVIRLSRALAALLALLMRWVALVQALRLALKAARALADPVNAAWAHHELGTLSLGAEDAAAANAPAQRALRLREQIGDQAGAEVTQHNLAVLRKAFRPGSAWTKPLVVSAVLAGVALLALVLWLLLKPDPEPAVDTVAPVVTLDEVPESPTTERSASFAFSADEEVRKFECRLDDGPFQDCVSPHNIPGPLAFGEHTFAVRATDFAGNTGEPAQHRWQVERGEGPEATIIEAPDPLTNQTLAEFTIEAPGAIRLECRLDDTLLKSCPTRVALEVDEGDHTFVVQAFNADEHGRPAGAPPLDGGHHAAYGHDRLGRPHGSGNRGGDLHSRGVREPDRMRLAAAGPGGSRAGRGRARAGVREPAGFRRADERRRLPGAGDRHRRGGERRPAGRSGDRSLVGRELTAVPLLVAWDS